MLIIECVCIYLAVCIHCSLVCRFEFVCIPVVNPRYKREFLEGPAKERDSPLTRSDLLLNSNG